MKSIHFVLAAALALATAPVGAHESSQHATKPVAPPMEPATQEAIAVVEQFGAALKAADMATVTRLLDERVLILESGGAERSRDEYLGHHAISDAKFLGGATITPKQRSAQVYGDTAWVGSESEISAVQGTDAKTLLSTETMVLRRTSGAWKIVHIHWSSRAKKAGAK